MALRIRHIAVLVLVLVAVVACGGTQTVDITTSETKVVSKRIVETSSTMVEASAQVEPSALNVVPDLTVECTLNTEQLNIFCQAIGYQTESLLMWTSTASWAYGEGDQWQFTIDEELIVPSTLVSLEECQSSNCQTINTSIDTSELVSEETTSRTASAAPIRTSPSRLISTATHASTPIPSSVPEPQSLLVLPFTMEHEPTGMMPMGETAIHSREAPWGHPGIDFQWPGKTPMVIALDGEIVQIITQDSKQPGLPEYTVAVITNEFIVNYEVIELYSVNSALEVGVQVVAGQLIGYAIPMGLGEGMHMTHWSFGTHVKNDELKPNPEGIVTLYYTEYLCPVPYFTEPERQRLSRIWEIANYNERAQFPDLCNGPYKNY